MRGDNNYNSNNRKRTYNNAMESPSLFQSPPLKRQKIEEYQEDISTLVSCDKWNDLEERLIENKVHSADSFRSCSYHSTYAIDILKKIASSTTLSQDRRKKLFLLTKLYWMKGFNHPLFIAAQQDKGRIERYLKEQLTYYSRCSAAPYGTTSFYDPICLASPAQGCTDDVNAYNLMNSWMIGKNFFSLLEEFNFEEAFFLARALESGATIHTPIVLAYNKNFHELQSNIEHVAYTKKNFDFSIQPFINKAAARPPSSQWFTRFEGDTLFTILRTQTDEHSKETLLLIHNKYERPFLQQECAKTSGCKNNGLLMLLAGEKFQQFEANLNNQINYITSIAPHFQEKSDTLFKALQETIIIDAVGEDKHVGILENGDDVFSLLIKNKMPAMWEKCIPFASNERVLRYLKNPDDLSINQNNNPSFTFFLNLHENFSKGINAEINIRDNDDDDANIGLEQSFINRLTQCLNNIFTIKRWGVSLQATDIRVSEKAENDDNQLIELKLTFPINVRPNIGKLIEIKTSLTDYIDNPTSLFIDTKLASENQNCLTFGFLKQLEKEAKNSAQHSLNIIPDSVMHLSNKFLS